MQIENFLETAMKRTCCRICDYTEVKQWWNECFRDLYVNDNNMLKSATEINSKTEESKEKVEYGENVENW